jgi:sodium-coupled neutral amino acid transporter 11
MKNPKHPPSPFFHPSTPRHVVIARLYVSDDNLTASDTEPVIEHKSGLLGCTANMMTCIVGSGIVGIPYAIKQAGFLAGTFLIFFVAMLTDKSLRLLVSTAKHIHVPTYELAAEAVFSKAGFNFILFNMFVIAYGAMVSYLMVVRDSFSLLLKIDPEDSFKQNIVLLAVSLTIQLPLSCLRDMADLDKTSRLAVLIDCLLVGIVAFSTPWKSNLEERGGLFSLLTSDIVHVKSIFVGLGVLSFAFECQESAFLVAGSLQNPTLKRWSRVTMSAASICAALAALCGVTGYVGYFDQTEGNILNNLNPMNLSGKLAHGLLGATMFATYPLASFVARHVCVVLLFEGRRAHEGDDASILNRTDRRVILTIALYIMAMLPAVFFQDFGTVLALAGVIGGSCLAYIGPGVLFLGVHGGQFMKLVNESWFYPKKDIESMSAIRIPTTVAVETTPLVHSQAHADQIIQRQEKEKNQQKVESRTPLGILKTILFYLTNFPIWCKIASLGKRNLTRHVHELVSKSPHPIRIGDVQYAVVQILEDGKVDADPEESDVVFPPDYLRQHSAPVLGKSRVAFNEEVETTLISRLPRKRVIMNESLEPDPQEQPPGWSDFCVAIFFITFGIVALFAGLFSLMSLGDTDPAHDASLPTESESR